MWWTTSFPGLPVVVRDCANDHLTALKCKENWQKFLLLCIQTGDKEAKALFFVAYSQLCRHCHNLAEGGCLLSQFHFTLCRYFLGHVTYQNLPWQGLFTVWIEHQGSNWPHAWQLLSCMWLDFVNDMKFRKCSGWVYLSAYHVHWCGSVSIRN